VRWPSRAQAGSLLCARFAAGLRLPKLRRVVRRCLLARLVIGDPAPDGALREVADQALLSHKILERCVHQPLNEFSQRVRDE
jgi:hypothetical protein